MSTTALFVEILIVGLEAMVWVGFLIVTITDPDPVRPEWLQMLKDWSPLVTAVVFACAYVLGIFVDRAADSLFHLLRFHIKVPDGTPMGRMRMRVLMESDGMARFLDYQRSRLRIARATVFNLAAAIPVGVGYVITRTQGGASVAVGVVLLGLILLALAVLVTRRIERAHTERLLEAHDLVVQKSG